MKTELAEAHEKIKSLTLQVEEMNVLNAQRESKKENLKSKITELNSERLKSDEERKQLQIDNNQLKEKMLELSNGKEIDNNTIKLMEKEIGQLKTSVAEVESFVIEQHKLGFDKALQQAKYFYKIPIDERNFDMKKDFYKGELVTINEILEEEDDDATNINIMN